MMEKFEIDNFLYITTILGNKKKLNDRKSLSK